MKISFSLFVLFLLCFHCIHSQVEETVYLSSEKDSLQGTLLLPQRFNSGMVVLIIAGSGPTDRDGNQPGMRNNSLRMLASGLAANGVASLRYDKRGVGKSRAAMVEERKLRFNTYADDAAKWVLQLKQDNRFEQVIIAGHSEGSLLGMMAAKAANADSFISLAGPGRNAADLIREQLSHQSEEVLEVAEPILQKLEIGETVDEVPFGLYSLFRPSVQPYLSSWFVYNPEDIISELDVPIMIIQGTSDMQVSLEDANLLKQAYPAASLEVVKNMNHILKESSMDRAENLQTYSNDSLPLHPKIIPLITAFLQHKVH